MRSPSFSRPAGRPGPDQAGAKKAGEPAGHGLAWTASRTLDQADVRTGPAGLLRPLSARCSLCTPAAHPHDGMHSVSRHVRIGVAVEGRPHPGHHRPSKRASAAGHPGGTSDDRHLSDNQPGCSLNGVATRGGNNIAGEQAAAVRATVA